MIATLKLVRKVLINEIETLSDQKVNKKLNEEQWSVSQVIRHLIYSDKVMLPALKKALQTEDEKLEEKNLDFILDRTIKIKSPFPEPSAEFATKEELITMLNEARTPLEEYINEIFDIELLENKSMRHPVFGPISAKQMIEFLILHERRHIEQIKQLKEEMNLKG